MKEERSLMEKSVLNGFFLLQLAFSRTLPVPKRIEALESIQMADPLSATIFEGFPSDTLFHSFQDERQLTVLQLFMEYLLIPIRCKKLIAYFHRV